MKFLTVTILRGGDRIFHLPVDFSWALQQCSADMLLVINIISEDRV